MEGYIRYRTAFLRKIIFYKICHISVLANDKKWILTKIRITRKFSATLLLLYQRDTAATAQLNVRLDIPVQFLYRAFISCVV